MDTSVLHGGLQRFRTEVLCDRLEDEIDEKMLELADAKITMIQIQNNTVRINDKLRQTLEQLAVQRAKYKEFEMKGIGG
jgi:hypothetical protein